MIAFLKFDLIIRTMSPPAGKAQSLHQSPNRGLSSESELRLPEFMWVPLLWHITSSSDPPVGFTCLVELYAQTLTCSLCCSGGWPRQGATVNGDWRGKGNAHCLKADHRFCAFYPPFKVVGSLSDAALLPVMTKDWATMLPHSACTQNASRRARTAVNAVYVFLLDYKCFRGTSVFYLQGNSEVKQEISVS